MNAVEVIFLWNRRSSEANIVIIWKLHSTTWIHGLLRLLHTAKNIGYIWKNNPQNFCIGISVGIKRISWIDAYLWTPKMFNSSNKRIIQYLHEYYWIFCAHPQRMIVYANWWILSSSTGIPTKKNELFSAVYSLLTSYLSWKIQ